MKTKIVLLVPLLSLGLAQQQPIKAQNETVLGPPLHASAKQLGITWLSRSTKWEVNSFPLFLREKAFERKTLLPQHRGKFVMMASPGGDGKGHDFTVWALKRVSPRPDGAPDIDSAFYNGNASWSFYSPLFSPDGNRVVARFGLPPDDVRNSFSLAIWNLSNGQIVRPRLYSEEELEQGKPKPKSWTYFNSGVYWSPGGRYLSFVRGGDSVGGYFDALGNPRSPNGYELWLSDTKTNGFARRLAVNVGLSWSWTNHGTLLYSGVTSKDAVAVQTRTGRPSIYEVAVRDGASEKLFDGGYFANESPDGQWIAFADWPGNLLERKNPTAQHKAENDAVKPGIYLFHRLTKRRVLVGEFPSAPPKSLAFQWTPDSRWLYVLNTQQAAQGPEGVLYRMEIKQQRLERLSALSIVQPMRSNNISNSNWFEFRGISPDGTRLYANTSQYILDGPKNYINARYTMWSINGQTGEFTPMANLTDIANENPGWDWHDDSGVNSAFVAAEKLESALPQIGNGNVDPEKRTAPH